MACSMSSPTLPVSSSTGLNTTKRNWPKCAPCSGCWPPWCGSHEPGGAGMSRQYCDGLWLVAVAATTRQTASQSAGLCTGVGCVVVMDTFTKVGLSVACLGLVVGVVCYVLLTL